VALVTAVILFLAMNIVVNKSLYVRVFGGLCLLLATAPLAYGVYGFAENMREGRNAAEVESSAARVQMWARGQPQIERNPLTGFGDGAALQIAGIRVGTGLTVDDFYLTQLIDFGYLHLVILISFILLCGITFLLLPLNPIHRSIAAALASGGVAIVIGQKATSISEGMGFLFLYMGLLAGLWRKVSRDAVRGVPRGSLRAPAPAAGYGRAPNDA